ncbi:MAG TPA: globin domain-containing protein [Ktedonosporobacter sp.]|nr:globin domain-containing protein [Ktedonosporobacter sp.]
MLSQKLLIPQRTPYALDNTIYTSPWATTWQRVYRQVFWLSDGRRDIRRIATLLHKTEAVIEQVVRELTVGGYTSMQVEKKVLIMDAALLKQSFEMIIPQREAFARSFYQRLFAYYPETRQLFAHTDIKRQGSSLLATLATIVAGVQRGDNLALMLQSLGERHQHYGAAPDHYPLVGGVLLETFSEYLGPRFTLDMQDAWSKAFEIISSHMIAAYS